MTAVAEIVPAILDRIRRTLVGLRMPRALEVLDRTVRQLERGEVSPLDAIDTLLAEELTVRESRLGDPASDGGETRSGQRPCETTMPAPNAGSMRSSPCRQPIPPVASCREARRLPKWMRQDVHQRLGLGLG